MCFKDLSPHHHTRWHFLNFHGQFYEELLQIYCLETDGELDEVLDEGQLPGGDLGPDLVLNNFLKNRFIDMNKKSKKYKIPNMANLNIPLSRSVFSNLEKRPQQQN